MQTKLTKQEIGKLKQARSGISGGVLWSRTNEGYDYWQQVIDGLDAKIKHGTSDGKPYVEPEPTIPEGWRKAEADEWTRNDVQYWDTTEKSWMKRPCMGDPFDSLLCGTRYIVPVDPPLTDQDACVWPRLLVMVRDCNDRDWQGPFEYVCKEDSSSEYLYVVRGNGGRHAWKQARRATPAEIEKASKQS